MYHDVDINVRVLNDFPVDGLLPYVMQGIDSSASIQVTTAQYDNINAFVSQDNSNANNTNSTITLQDIVITDLEGYVSATTLQSAVISHMKDKDRFFICIPHGDHPMNEFNNSMLLPMAYPALFPYGQAGFENVDC